MFVYCICRYIRVCVCVLGIRSSCKPANGRDHPSGIEFSAVSASNRFKERRRYKCLVLAPSCIYWILLFIIYVQTFIQNGWSPLIIESNGPQKVSSIIHLMDVPAISGNFSYFVRNIPLHSPCICPLCRPYIR